MYSKRRLQTFIKYNISSSILRRATALSHPFFLPYYIHFCLMMITKGIQKLANMLKMSPTELRYRLQQLTKIFSLTILQWLKARYNSDNNGSIPRNSFMFQCTESRLASCLAHHTFYHPFPPILSIPLPPSSPHTTTAPFKP